MTGIKTSKRPSAIKKGAGGVTFDIINHALLIIVALMCLLPFMHVMAMSLSSP